MPNVDMGQFYDTTKRNMDAFSDVAQMTVESMQAIMRRGSEIVHNNSANIFNSMKEVASSSNAEHAMQKQQQFAQDFMKQSMNDAKEMMEMYSKSTMELFHKFSHHANDVASMNQPAKSNKKA